MKQLTIEQPKEVLQVNYKDNVFEIPLAGSMPFQELLEIREAEGSDKKDRVLDLLRKYIPEDIYHELTADAIMQIVKAWSEESAEAAGVTPGES